MRFLKLKKVGLRNTADGTPIWINPDYIISIEHHHNDGTRIKVASFDTHSTAAGLHVRSDTVLVGEKPEEVIRAMSML